MTRVDIFSGACGSSTVIEAVADGGGRIGLKIQSDCKAVQELGGDQLEVDPFQEISFRGEGPLTLRLAQQVLPHPACPVPAGIIKAVEVESGLALAADATIKVSKEGPEQ